MKKTFSLTTIFATVLALILSACGNATATPAAQETVVPSSAVIAEGRIEPVYAANLSFLAKGVVQEVNVKIGDKVNAGDALVKLASADTAEAQVVAAQQAYDALLRNESGDRARLWQAYMDAQKARGTAEKKWDDLNVKNIEDRIEDDKAAVEDRVQDVKDAQDEFDKYKDLAEDNTKRKDAKDTLDNEQDNLNEAIRKLETTTRERDTVRAAYDAALAAEAEAKYQYELTLDGPNADQLALAKSQLDAALDALDAYVITAPFSGVVADVNVKVGEQVGPEVRAVSIIDPGTWIGETTDVTELEVVKITVGQPVSIVADALPGVALTGTVSEISQAYVLQGGDILYTVRIEVEEIDPLIRWGMTVEVTFETLEN